MLQHFVHVKVSDVDAAVIGSAALSAGVGVGHAVGAFGLRGIASVVWNGRPKPSTLTTPSQ